MKKHLQKSQPLVFYDPVYQKILMHDENHLIKKLIYTKEFQRLRYIRQLGSMSFLLNSVNHARWSHSLGVANLIGRLFLKNQIKKLNKDNKIDPKEWKKSLQEIQVAGLLHDLGHGPLSHLFEKIVDEFHHEQATTEIIKNPDGEIYPILKEYDLNIDRICDLILTKTTDDWGQSLISGQFDLDRLDYLLRDRYFVGLSNSGINLDRLLDNIIIRNNKVVFRDRALLDLENFLFFRFYMHKTFFTNEQNIFLDQMITNIFKRLKELAKNKHQFQFNLGHYETIIYQKPLNFKTLLKLTDNNLLTLLQDAYDHTNDHILKKLLQLILYPKEQRQFSTKTINDNYRKILQKLNYSEEYFVINAEKKLNVYQANKNEIYIFDSETKTITPLSKVSLFFNKNITFTKKYQLITKLT